MSRIKLQLPDTFSFAIEIEVRIADLNYGNHLGNDKYLSYLHEARMQFFQSFGFTEMNLAGTSVIMGDSVLVYKKECRFGDRLKIEVTAADFGPRSFDLYYRMSLAHDGSIVCEAKTGMVCYDYAIGKTTAVPLQFIELVNKTGAYNTI